MSILTDQECTNSIEVDEDYDGRDLENADAVLNVDSCVNRCFQNATVKLSANGTLSCSCSLDCDPKETCCPDFFGELEIFNFKNYYFLIKYEKKNIFT